MDAQTIVDTVAALDETTAVAIVTSILQSRPELAPPVVSYAVPDLTYPPAKAMTEGRSRGFIKSINTEKGYGFVSCDELNKVFGSDVFMHINQAKDFTAGTPVSFAVMLNKDNRPQAYDVLAEDGNGNLKGFGGKGGGASRETGGHSGFGGSPLWGATAAGPTPSKGGGDKGAGKDDSFNNNAMMQMMMGMMGMGGGGGGGNNALMSKACGEKGDGKKGSSKGGKESLGEFLGLIKSFNAKAGYGFIECQDMKNLGCNNDVFLHHQQLGEFEVGAWVQFTAYMNNKGQPQAKELKACEASGGGDEWEASKKIKLAW